MSRNKKRFIFITLVILTGVFLINNSFQRPISNSVEKGNSPTHRIPLNDLKKSAQKKNLNI